MRKTIYSIWYGIKSRCENPNNVDYYNNENITLCEEWQTFENFYNWAINNGYKKGLFVARKNIDSGFNAENCIIQNKPNYRERMVVNPYTHKLETLQECCKNCNIPYATAKVRLSKGWTEEKTFTTPSAKNKHIGEKIGEITILEKTSKNNKTIYKCQCSCGKIIYRYYSSLVRSKHASCGCYNPIKQVSKNFTILEYFVKNERGYYKCECKCGNLFEVRSDALNKRKGCKQCTLKNRKMPKRPNSKCLGKSNSRLYVIHRNMINRCYNETNHNYTYYGGRGIKVCEEWKNDFVNFYNWAINNGYSEELTLDRIDNSGDYSSDNCRWITIREQNKNRSCTKWITHPFDNIETTLGDLAIEYQIPYQTLLDRMRFNWNIKEAILTPPHEKKNFLRKHLYFMWKNLKATQLKKIEICDEWLDFEVFYNWCLNNGYKNGLYICKIDNEDIYKSNNCKFTKRKPKTKKQIAYIKTYKNYSKCICGKILPKNNNLYSCGCRTKHEEYKTNKIGQRINHFLILDSNLTCLCDCGNIIPYNGKEDCGCNVQEYKQYDLNKKIYNEFLNVEQTIVEYSRFFDNSLKDMIT